MLILTCELFGGEQLPRSSICARLDRDQQNHGPGTSWMSTIPGLARGDDLGRLASGYRKKTRIWGA